MSDEETTTEEETAVEEEQEAEKTKGVSEAEIKKRIEAARKQEKDKLYDTINTLKDQVQELTVLQKKEREQKEKIEKEATQKAEKERLQSLSAEEKLAEQLKKIEEQLAHEATARGDLEEKLQIERKVRELEEYKSKLLREAGDEIIPELVTGDSREEIERNAALAKTRYQQIFEAQAAKAEGNKKTPRMPSPTDPDPTPVEEQELAQNVGDLDIDPERYYGSKRIKRDEAYVAEINKKRQELSSKIAAAYKRQSGY